MKKEKTKKKPITKKRKSESTRWVDPMEKRHRDMLGLNGEEAYSRTFGW